MNSFQLLWESRPAVNYWRMGGTSCSRSTLDRNFGSTLRHHLPSKTTGSEFIPLKTWRWEGRRSQKTVSKTRRKVPRGTLQLLALPQGLLLPKRSVMTNALPKLRKADKPVNVLSRATTWGTPCWEHNLQGVTLTCTDLGKSKNHWLIFNQRDSRPRKEGSAPRLHCGTNWKLTNKMFTLPKVFSLVCLSQRLVL